MRELVKMFSNTSTLDDIGIGQVRDSLADQMFPATSTVHARARYFLFIPWIHGAAAAKFSGTAVLSKASSGRRSVGATPVSWRLRRAGRLLANRSRSAMVGRQPLRSRRVVRICR